MKKIFPNFKMHRATVLLDASGRWWSGNQFGAHGTTETDADGHSWRPFCVGSLEMSLSFNVVTQAL